jgi:adenine-specific DNA-methyltransferase
LNEIFQKKSFNYPKPVELVSEILRAVSNKKSIILDSFAGSGTTGHAVLNLNKEDNGDRHFILIEMENYASDVTAERIKKIIKGYNAKEEQIDGTGGSFDYYELGHPLFDEHQNLNEEVPIPKIREYIWYSETRSAFIEPKSSTDTEFLLGSKDRTVYYFVYDKNGLTTLDYDLLSTIKTKGEQYVIYADNCLLSKEFMAKNNIIFKKIPRDISRF